MPPATPPSRLAAFFEKFTMLRTAPRELWVIYGAYVLENLAYKAGAASVLTLWLSSDLGFGDKSAGAMFATWSAIMTLITVLVGPLTDVLGIRRTFIMGFWVCLISRTVMTFTTTKWLVLPFGLYLQAVGIALMGPVMVAAMKRYSTAAQRSVAFSLYYALMNLGFAGGDLIFDKIRGPGGLGEHGHWVVPLLNVDLSTYRVLILLSVVFTIPGLLMVWGLLRDGVEMTESGMRIVPRPEREASELNWGLAVLTTCRQTLVQTGHIFAGLWKQPAFLRFITFMTLVVFVRMVFFHLNVTFPKFGLRELGDGAPFAQLTGVLNSLLIVVLVPICGVLTQRFTAYRMVITGSLISALSVFFIAMPPEWFQPLADGWLGDWIGHRWLGVNGPVNPYFISIFFFILLLSAGEALWSPRLYEYAAAIAPKGQEASYMSLSMLPYFGAKFLVGGSSGFLLEKYCPASGARDSATMWLIIACMALITPVGAFVFRKFLQVHEEGRDDAH